MKKNICILLTICLMALPIHASSIADKRNELSNAEQHITDKQSELEKKTEAKKTIEQEIRKFDIEIVEVQDKIKELDEQLEEKEKQIDQSQIELDKANEKKDEQYDATKARMRQMYKNQKISYLQVIFSADNFWEAINRIEYMRCISKKDNTILDTYQEQIDNIEEKKAEIEKEERELDLLQKSAIVKNEELEENRAKKEDAMSRLAAEEDKLESEIENLEEISDTIKAEIERLTIQQQNAQSSGNSGGGGISGLPNIYEGGTFQWPVPGYYRISSDYSPRVSPISGKSEFHSGIDIPASYGQNVIAAADGVVITAGWINGYGNTVMVSHGSGLVTLYAHNSSLIVSVGQQVKQGQPIAKIGSTGYSTGNHCHFEVRLNGNHTSPWPYLND